MSEFHGAQTKQVAGVPGISRTFAIDVMCHPLLLALCDRVLLPSCARYQLNLGHLLQRGPGCRRAVAASRRAGVERRAVAAPAAAARVGDRVRRLHARQRRDARRSRQSPLARPRAARARADAARRPRPNRSRTPRCRPVRPWCTSAARSMRAAPTRPTCPRRGAHLSYCLGWLRTEENNYLSIPPSYVEDAAAPRAGAARLLGARQHRSRRRLPRHGAHAGPGRADRARRARLTSTTSCTLSRPSR